jgi:hypothetical protein
VGNKGLEEECARKDCTEFRHGAQNARLAILSRLLEDWRGRPSQLVGGRFLLWRLFGFSFTAVFVSHGR